MALNGRCLRRSAFGAIIGIQHTGDVGVIHPVEEAWVVTKARTAERIAALVLVKEALAAADITGLWEHGRPAAAASADDLAMVQTAIGEALDPQLCCFLEHADGWPAFFQAVDLFGTSDYLGSSRFKSANEMLSIIEEAGALVESGMRRDELMPIAASSVAGERPLRCVEWR